MSLLIVIPTYDEADNLPRIARSVLDACPGADLLVVDDASPDGTAEVARRLGAETGGRVSLLSRPGKLGLGTAYLDGFRLGLERGYERFVQMDADFSHRPEDLPRLVAGLASADLVIGSRYVRGGGTMHWGRGRRFVSRGGSAYARTILGLPVQDATGGFKAWRRGALRAVDFRRVRSNGYCFQVEMTWRAHRAGARIREVPILFPDRRVGRSKMSRAILLEAVWRVPALALGVI